MKPGDYCIKTYLVRGPCKNVLLTSSYYMCQTFMIAKLKISQIIDDLTTKLNISVKSTPSHW